MKVADLLERTQLSGSELARRLGYQADTVNWRKREGLDVPKHWWPRLQKSGMKIDEYMTVEDLPPDDAADFREDDSEPTPGPDAPRAPQPVIVDYATVAGYIEGAYKLSAEMLIKQQDPMLAEVIQAHAAPAGQAWAHWIESEPKVAALIQRMMIGTPLGEVIGVHVGIVFSYTLARSAARAVAADVADRTSDTEVAQDGRLDEAAADFVG